MLLPPVLKQSFLSWQKHNAAAHAAAVSFFALLSIAPILVIALGIAGFFIDPMELERSALLELQNMVGLEGARVLLSMLESARTSSHSFVTSIIGIAITLFAATKVLAQLRLSINQIWGVEIKPGRHFSWFFWRKALSMTLILTFGTLLLVLVMASSLMHVTFGYMVLYVPALASVIPVADVLLSLLLTSLFCMLLFTILPDAKISWRDALAGAAFTGTILTIGKTIIALYLSRTNVISAYGLAGSVIAVLLWLYLSALIFFLGAEFTHAYAQMHGFHIFPKAHAQAIGERMGVIRWIVHIVKKIFRRP